MSTAAPSHIELDWPHDPDYAAVGRLVLSGVASRLDLPVDRVDDLGLALEMLTRWPIEGDRLCLDVDVHSDRLAVTLGPFAGDPLEDRSIHHIVVALVGDVGSVADPEGHRVVIAIPAQG